MFSFFRKKEESTQPSQPADQAANGTADAMTPIGENTPEQDATSLPEVSASSHDHSANLSWRERLKLGLSKTRRQLGQALSGLWQTNQIDESMWEELESSLWLADVGVDATEVILSALRKRVRQQGIQSGEALKEALIALLAEHLMALESPLVIGTQRPYVLLLAGVNGAGKTTTIGKLAHHFQQQGLSVLLAAGDTFRAAAKEQLMTWGERNQVTVIAQEDGDPAAVIYDAIQMARARKIDVVLADTAGRLSTQAHLMRELSKIKRVIQKAEPSAPHEVCLVLDATTGQNALSQIQAFDEALGLTGLIMTKLDGTARGGVLAAIAQTFAVPLRFIGVGEQKEDLQAFVALDYARAMLDS